MLVPRQWEEPHLVAQLRRSVPSFIGWPPADQTDPKWVVGHRVDHILHHRQVLDPARPEMSAQSLAHRGENRQTLELRQIGVDFAIEVVRPVCADRTLVTFELAPERKVAPTGAGGENAGDVFHAEPRSRVLRVYPDSGRVLAGRVMLGVGRVVPTHLDVGGGIAVARRKCVALLKAHVPRNRAQRGLTGVDACDRETRSMKLHVKLELWVTLAEEGGELLEVRGHQVVAGDEDRAVGHHVLRPLRGRRCGEQGCPDPEGCQRRCPNPIHSITPACSIQWPAPSH